MKTPRIRKLALATAASLVLLGSGSANAVFRAYLSVNGNDSSPTCSVTQPCRLLPAALAVVDAGGEIWMLDSANFNTSVVSVTKSVTILAIPGQKGSVVGLGGTALSISGAGIEVTLQNLNILSFNGTGDIGVLVGNAARVTIDRCDIFGFKGFNDGLGIWVNPGANAPKVFVLNSVLRGNHHGIVVAGNGRATISRTSIIGNNGVGVWANSGTGIATVHVADSISSGNAAGFAVTGSAGAFNSNMFVTRSVASENVGAGFSTDGGLSAFLVVDNSMSTNNATGFSNTTGNALTLQTRVNNTVTDNVLNVSGPTTAQGGT